MLINTRKKNSASTIIYVSLRIIMALMLAVCILGVCIDKDESMRSRYVFNAVQAFFFLIVSFVPKFVKKIKIEISEYAMIIFILFCFAHFFFGEIVNFYAKIKWWDSLLHTFSGGMIALLSYSFIYLLNGSDKEKLNLSPLFVALFAFCFAVVVGVIWECIEWVSDEISGGNMQRWANSITNEPFIGREALKDTMKDLLLDMIGASFVCAVNGAIMHKNIDALDDLIILRKDTSSDSFQEELNGESVNLTKEEINVMIDADKIDNNASDEKK